MNSLEKLISNLSTYWDIEPEKVVDRLNNMNESELKEIVNKMTKKFVKGGMIDCLRNGGSISKCKCGCDKIAKAQDGDKVLPQFAKIIEGGGPENKPRTIYYSQNRKDLSRFPNNIKDGDLISEEKLLNPGYWWRNELSKTGLWNRPVEAAEYAKPSYQRYVQHDNSGLNLQRAVEIDPVKAAEETTQKINKIRGNKFECGGPLPKKKKEYLKK